MGPALLDRLDRIMAELAELRAEMVASANGADVRAYVSANPIEHEPDDLAPDSLLDTCAASAGYPQDTIRKWCRTEGLGIHTGGRWLVSIPRLQRRGGDRLSLLRSPFVDGARRQVTKAVSGRLNGARLPREREGGAGRKYDGLGTGRRSSVVQRAVFRVPHNAHQVSLALIQGSATLVRSQTWNRKSLALT
jgi:hypothetical protein